jgi:hypothetical protein
MGKRNPEIDKMVASIGAIAELAHTFYSAMVRCGASPSEATAGMQGFIAAFWHDSMEEGRRKQREAQQNEEETE